MWVRRSTCSLIIKTYIDVDSINVHRRSTCNVEIKTYIDADSINVG